MRLGVPLNADSLAAARFGCAAASSVSRCCADCSAQSGLCIRFIIKKSRATPARKGAAAKIAPPIAISENGKAGAVLIDSFDITGERVGEGDHREGGEGGVGGDSIVERGAGDGDEGCRSKGGRGVGDTGRVGVSTDTGEAGGATGAGG